MKIPLSTIETAIKKQSKREILNFYESLEFIRVCDSAFPVQTYDCFKEQLNVPKETALYIGDWCMAYGEDIFRYGVLLPCCSVSLAFLLLAIKSETPNHAILTEAFNIGE